MRPNRQTLILIMLLLLGGCASNPTPGYDYSAFNSHPPKSVLVLPPLNDSVDVNAPYVYLSTVTQPLAESGYYVFPVAVIDAFLKENGLPTPDEMNSVSLDKIRENIGADAVLYVHIEEWGQKYRVLSSDTVVKATATLIDVGTGSTLWEGVAQARVGSGDGGGSLLGMVMAAVIDQVVDSSTQQVHQVCGFANNNMIRNEHTGLPLGPYNPKYSAQAR